jgi:hypothetical protein
VSLSHQKTDMSVDFLIETRASRSAFHKISPHIAMWISPCTSGREAFNARSRSHTARLAPVEGMTMPSRYCSVLAGALLLSAASPLLAQTPLPPVTVGAGLQTSFVYDAPKDGDGTARFPLNSVRLYVNGPVTDKVKFMFNTEYVPATNDVGVLDAVARFEMNPQFNIWAGRFLPPSDRANLYGPYYSHHWAVYSDGIQDG